MFNRSRTTSTSFSAMSSRTLTFYQMDLGVDDRLGRKAVNRGVLQTENVAHQVKGANLAAAVQEKLVASYRPFGHLIDILGRLVLAEDLYAFVVAEFAKIDPRPGHSKLRRGAVSTKASKHGYSPGLDELVKVFLNASPIPQSRMIYNKRRCAHYCLRSHCPLGQVRRVCHILYNGVLVFWFYRAAWRY